MDLPLRFFLDGELYLLVDRRDPTLRDRGFAELLRRHGLPVGRIGNPSYMLAMNSIQLRLE